MKKHLLSLPAIFFLLTFNLVVKAYTTPGNKLNVWLLEGIQLKETPSEKSKTLTILPYGTPVTIVKENTPQKPFTVNFKSDAFKTPYKLKGQWLKIDFNGKAGYVFDGYLSAMPELHKDAHGNLESEEDYLKRNYGILKIEKSSPKKDIEKKIIYYKNGTVLRQSTAEGCVDVELNFKNISLNEAMLFQKVLHTQADATEGLKIAQQQNHTVKISYYACD